MDRVREAGGRAWGHDEIEAFPMGYQSLVGDMRGTLLGRPSTRSAMMWP